MEDQESIFRERIMVFLRALQARGIACGLRPKASKTQKEYWYEAAKSITETSAHFNAYLKQLNKANGQAAGNYYMDYGMSKLKVKKEKRRLNQELKKAFFDLFR